MEYSDNNILFSSETGCYINDRHFRRSFERLLNHAEVEKKPFHKFRHTYATKLFEQSLELDKVNHLLGHDEDMDITKIYIHVTSKRKKIMAQKINHIYNQ